MFAYVNFFGKSSSSESSTNHIPPVSNHFCGRTVKKISIHSQAFIQRVCEIFRKTLRGISLYLPFSERRRGLKLPKDKNLAWKVIKDCLIKAPDAKNLKISGVLHPIPRFILESCCDKYSTLPVSELTSEKEIHFSDGRFRINGFWRMTLEEMESPFKNVWKNDPIAIKGNCLEEFKDFLNDLNDLNDFKSNKGSSLLTEKNVLSIFYLSNCMKLSKLKGKCIEFLEHSVKLDINFIRNHEAIIKKINHLLSLNEVKKTSGRKGYFLSEKIKKQLEYAVNEEEFSKIVEFMLIFNRFELSFGYGDVRLNDNQMKKICECHHLKKLYLSSQSNITSIDYCHISKLTSLESLTLSYCKVTDETVLSLRGLPLKHLDLGHNFEVTERSLEVVVSLPFLEELELIHCGIKNDGINLLSQALNLKKLGLWGVTISKENLKELQKLQQLQSLDLGCRSIEIDQSWIDLLATFPALTKLNIREWKSAQTLDLSPLTNKGIEIIKN